MFDGDPFQSIYRHYMYFMEKVEEEKKEIKKYYVY